MSWTQTTPCRKMLFLFLYLKPPSSGHKTQTQETEGCGKAHHKAGPCARQGKCHHISCLPQRAEEDESRVSAWGVEKGSQERRGGQMPVGSAMRKKESILQTCSLQVPHS